MGILIPINVFNLKLEPWKPVGYLQSYQQGLVETIFVSGSCIFLSLGNISISIKLSWNQ